MKNQAGKGKGPEKGRNLKKFRENWDEINWGSEQIVTGSLKDQRDFAIFNIILDDWGLPRL
jgi:hypothetical protein